MGRLRSSTFVHTIDFAVLSFSFFVNYSYVDDVLFVFWMIECVIDFDLVNNRKRNIPLGNKFIRFYRISSDLPFRQCHQFAVVEMCTVRPLEMIPVQYSAVKCTIFAYRIFDFLQRSVCYSLL